MIFSRELHKNEAISVLTEVVRMLPAGIWLVRNPLFFDEEVVSANHRVASEGEDVCYLLSTDELNRVLRASSIWFDWTELYFFEECPIVDDISARGVCQFAAQCIDMTFWLFETKSDALERFFLGQPGSFEVRDSWGEFLPRYAVVQNR